MEYGSYEIWDYLQERRTKDLMYTLEAHNKFCDETDCFSRQINDMTIYFKRDIACSVNKIVSIIHQFYKIPVQDTDERYLLFPKGFSQDFFNGFILMRNTYYFEPMEFCEIRSVSIKGVDRQSIPRICFRGDPYEARHKIGDYETGTYERNGELVVNPEPPLESYFRVSGALRKLVDPHNLNNPDQWVALINYNKPRNK